MIFVTKSLGCFMRFWGCFLPIKNRTVIFSSFGGRKFDDSPKAIYDEMCSRKEFEGWTFIWAFVEPDNFNLPRGKKVKIDTPQFFHALLSSKVWVGNSGIDRGMNLRSKKHISVETWHGTPLKRICGEEATAYAAFRPERYKGKIDNQTIRCAQSEHDRTIFQRLFHASKDSILLYDLPRNDSLSKYTPEDFQRIKGSLNIPPDKKVILYTPTYREYLVNNDYDTYLAPPINLEKWESRLGKDYVFLIRAHYAVTAALNVKENDFVRDVSSYPTLNDLYIIADLMISDYSSTYFDYAILNRPMLCFAYDEDEYETKRGLYLNLADTLPCEIDKDEDSLLERISNLDYAIYSERAKVFHQRFAPFAGKASKRVVDEVLKRVNGVF